MKIIPMQEFDLEMWKAAHAAAFNPEFQHEMGFSDEAVIPAFEFYTTLVDRYNAGKFYAWAALNSDGEFVAYNMLSLHDEIGEWEIGTSVTDRKHLHSGAAVRLHLHALDFAFNELEVPWVWALSNNRIPEVMSILERGGYVPFGPLFLMHKDMYHKRWGGRK